MTVVFTGKIFIVIFFKKKGNDKITFKKIGLHDFPSISFF